MVSLIGKKSIAYIRASNDHDVESQLSEIKAFAIQKGLVLARVLIEKPGDGRTVWRKTMALIRTRTVDTLIVWSLDRIDSQFEDLEGFILFLKSVIDAQVTFVSVRDCIDTSEPTTTFIENVATAVRKFKSKRKGERVHRGLHLAQQRGTRIGRPKVRNDSAIRQLRSSGKSIRQIAAELSVSTWAVHSALKTKEGDRS